ncbi:signal peptidase I [Methylocella sp. CPCC 101449]|jgi:signal peptidase I|uniref:signal peptidase I n=1 Tax=Methylocella sp. CPCC 101449 TaxID=2987531 RepID=UPI0028924F46|nr:signal peptidase I [Methylocella sp. CPCC 101449]MDT2020379.1 signal peptidase I [Methylocella sp. CPCC 101449]HEV2574681.1 signal peptidase I [Beijerinckiaceae bacterium]
MSKTRELIRTAVGALALMLVMRSLAFATYHVPSESMVPTLEVGDRFAALKFPFGYSRFSLVGGDYLPRFPGASGRIPAILPKHGDVVVFRHPFDGDDMVKRVIGLPGDRVAIRAGRLWLNGAEVPLVRSGRWTYRDPSGYRVAVTAYQERLPGAEPHTILLRDARSADGDMEEKVVPEGRLFMLGDNRDNSADSRFAEMGFVPLENLIGRADAILYSLASCSGEQGLRCPPRRLLERIE